MNLKDEKEKSSINVIAEQKLEEAEPTREQPAGNTLDISSSSEF